VTRPRLLDLFCGAGGAGMGYHRAGFDVTGVDLSPQPNYPFEFVQADALTFPLDGFDAIHASPVCKRYSAATPAWARASHPNQIPPTRKRLAAQTAPWVMENVPGAPLRPDLKICGCVVGLDELERERWFELGGWNVFDLRPPCYHAKPITSVAGHGRSSTMPSGTGLAADWRRVMDIDWMTRDELAQAIPPAYTEYIGRQLLDYPARSA
jgi:DNA (cytosine-5)-methyltransferase 1